MEIKTAIGIPVAVFISFMPRSHFSFFDFGFLSGEFAEVENAGLAHDAVAQNLDGLDVRRVEGENTLHTHVAGHLAHGERLGGALSFDLDDHALERLDTLLVTLDDAVVHVDGVAGSEFRDFRGILSLECLFCDFD